MPFTFEQLNIPGLVLITPRTFNDVHGFCVLSAQAVVHHKATAEYAPEYEAGIRWDDEELGIDWPVDEPVISEKDRNLHFFTSLKTVSI